VAVVVVAEAVAEGVVVVVEGNVNSSKDQTIKVGKGIEENLYQLNVDIYSATIVAKGVSK
jgi:hypothetical protein